MEKVNYSICNRGVCHHASIQGNNVIVPVLFGAVFTLLLVSAFIK